MGIRRHPESPFWHQEVGPKQLAMKLQQVQSLPAASSVAQDVAEIYRNYADGDVVAVATTGHIGSWMSPDSNPPGGAETGSRSLPIY